MRSSLFTIAIWIGALPCAGAAAWAEDVATARLVPARTYVGVNQPVLISIEAAGAAHRSLQLINPATGDVVEQASVVAEERLDLAALFPTLWTRRSTETLYAQLYEGARPVGSPLVLQPLTTPARASDALSAAVLEAAAKADRGAMERIMSAGASWRERQSQLVRIEETEGAGSLNGLRVYALKDVTLETSAGPMRVRLRPDAAPNTAFHFLHLVEGGLYDGLVFHRIVNADARGRPFIVQGGDPTGAGGGGPGFRIDFERSTLQHTFGVLSMARLPTDPNSGGSQFFICLSREACVALDGQYAAFGEVVEGAETLLLIAATPVGPLDPANPSSPHERPLEPPVIRRAFAELAPPFGTGPNRVERDAAPPAIR